LDREKIGGVSATLRIELESVNVFCVYVIPRSCGFMPGIAATTTASIWAT
jgi:hypothetical protein